VPRERTIESDVELGRHRGLAYGLWLPDGAPAGAVVVLHGAGSCKESHFDFGRAARDMGLAALAFDQRGHGGSEGRMGAGAIDDVVAMAAMLRERAGAVGAATPVPVALRGSSMGGWLALAAAGAADAAAVVAICPASGDQLARGLRDGRFEFAADQATLAPLLASADLEAAAAALRDRLLLMHAEADEQVPVEHSRALHAAAPESRIEVVPGGDHRSVQHDPEMQALAVRFIVRRCAAALAP
jgi:uncharacterized protein